MQGLLKEPDMNINVVKMKWGILILFLFVTGTGKGQDSAEPGSATASLFENVNEIEQEDIDDDSYLQELEIYRRRPLNLNTATEDQIAVLNILHELQIKNFILYRRLMGNLISIYELQAIPGWDLELIRRLLPYIHVGQNVSIAKNFQERFTGGTNSLLLRYATIIEQPAGYNMPITPGSQFYNGSKTQLMMRYRYNYRNLLQFSILGEKDAGEEFFKGSQKQGFGFYSGHLVLRNMGIVRCLVLGDFTVNMGQGLMQWQNFSFGKGASVLSIKKQSPTLVPYNSTGELNFQRGAGITIGRNKWETSIFLSHRKLSGNIDVDSNGNKMVTSFNSSGYYRTASEISDRGNTQQTGMGANIAYKTTRWHVALHAIHYSFSAQMQKQDEVYNLYAIDGKKWWNAGIDYNYTFKNVHFFGETAIDKQANTATLNGVVLSLDNKIDIAVLYRNISKKYQSLYAAAFTENTLPSNEKGLYGGISFRPFSSLKIDAYADVFHFPWLKYRLNKISTGKDYLLQINFTASRNIMIYSRIRYKLRYLNDADIIFPLQPVSSFPLLNWRFHTSIVLDSRCSIQHRVECSWFNQKSENKEEGFLFFSEYSRKLLGNKLQSSIRLQYFETTGYNSRIYAFERDLLFTASIPAFFDKGLRYYLNFRLDCGQLLHSFIKRSSAKIDLWLKWSQTIYSGKSSIGEGLDEINGNEKSNIRMQCLIFF